YVDAEDVATILRTRAVEFTPPVLFDITEQLAKGLLEFHSRRIVHGDFKPSNVMLSVRDGRPAVRILDIGAARRRVDNSLSDYVFFTPGYTPTPWEADMGFDVDIYGFGMTLVDLALAPSRFPVTWRRTGSPEDRTVIEMILTRKYGERFAELVM